MASITTKNLSKSFGKIMAVDNLSITFSAGEITGLIGPNGSGKSTLTNLLTGLLKPDSGSISIGGGTDIYAINPSQNNQRGITRTFQDSRLFEQMTVIDNLLIVLTQRNVFKAMFERNTQRSTDQSKQILTKVGLWHKRKSLVKDLSYGQRKLLSFGQTLAMNADIYIFDEPFSGLFPEMIKTIKNNIIELRTQNKTIIIIEHDMGLIRELSDRIVVLDAGKLLTVGAVGEVLSNKKVLEVYLGE